MANRKIKDSSVSGDSASGHTLQGLDGGYSVETIDRLQIDPLSCPRNYSLIRGRLSVAGKGVINMTDSPMIVPQRCLQI